MLAGYSFCLEYILNVGRFMQRASDLINVKVLDLEGGKVIGKVNDIIFSLQSGAILGISVKLPFLRRKEYLVRLRQIRSIGQDAVIIFSSDCLIEGKRPKGILNKPLMTQTGEFLGHITDVVFSKKERLVLGMEISRGFFDDLNQGRKLWPLTPEIVVGDVVLVPQNSQPLSPGKLLEQSLRLAPLSNMAENEWVSFCNRRD